MGQTRLRSMGARFLLPFEMGHLCRGVGEPIPQRVIAPLEQLEFRDKPVWERAAPHALYLQEHLDTVRTAVFGEPDRCWRVRSDVLGMLIRHGTRVLDAQLDVEIKPLDTFGIELFLSRFGFGVLSIGLETELDAAGSDEPVIGASAARRLVYGLSQISDYKGATLRLPHPSETGRAPAGASIPPAPTDDAPFLDRVGSPGGAFRLPELARWLLPLDVRPFQTRDAESSALPAFKEGQFNVYTVASVTNEGDHSLLDHPHAGELTRLLTDLAQLQEPQHAGSPIEDGHVAQRVLNRHHRAACSSLAAAHLALDQQANPDWNLQGPQIYLSKYFVSYLLAHHGRRHAERMIVDAGRLIESSSTSETLISGARQLTRELAEFSITGAVPTISIRHVINVWYQLCRDGDMVDLALDRASQAVERLERVVSAEQQSQIQAEQRRTTDTMANHMNTIAHVQVNVEWIEIFLIAVYALEVAHIVGHGLALPHAYVSWSLVLLPVIAAGLAFAKLRPDQLGRHQHAPRSQLSLLLLLGLLFGLWLGVGLVSGAMLHDAGDHDDHAARTSALDSGHPA